jgi:hypothetical protein
MVNLLTNIVISQTDNKYEDLLVLYVNEDFKNCYKKSLKYTVKDKTKKDPLPYLFVSKACYEMSQDHKYTEEFPKARKTALSYAVKYRKKDKEYLLKEDSEEFINDFKLNIIEELENYLEEGTEKTYSKAVGLTKKACGIDPDDYGAKLLYSILCTITKNKTYAKESLKICIPKLEEYEKSIPEWKRGALVTTDEPIVEEKKGMFGNLKSKVNETEAAKKYYESEEYQKVKDARDNYKDFKDNLKDGVTHS